MKTALVTGANKGIGFETVKQLASSGIFVFLGCRNSDKGHKAVEQIRSCGIENVALVPLDVTNDKSVEYARKSIEQSTNQLDILINNAGINGGAPFTALDANPSQFFETFNTNVIGVARVTQAFLELLKRSPAPRIVNVSTSVGSLALQSEPTWPAYDFAKYAVYGASKATLNMYTIHLAYELKDTTFKVNAVCPGYTQTDFTGHQGGDVRIAAQRIIKYALLDEDGPTGKFFSEETNPITGEIPW